MPVYSATGGGGGGSSVATPTAFAAGRYYGPPASEARQQLAWSNGNLNAVPLWVPGDETVDRIGLEVASAGTAGAVVRLGIYNTGANGLPGDLVLDAGTVGAETGGIKEIIISQALSAGTYWLVAANQGGASTPATHINFMGVAYPIGGATASDVTSFQMNGYYITGVTGALPATFGAPAGVREQNTCVFVRST